MALISHDDGRKEAHRLVACLRIKRSHTSESASELFRLAGTQIAAMVGKAARVYASGRGVRRGFVEWENADLGRWPVTSAEGEEMSLALGLNQQVPEPWNANYFDRSSAATLFIWMANVPGIC